MFGIVYVLWKTTISVISGARAAIEENEAKNQGRKLRAEGKNRANIYTDRLGHTRDLDTGKSVMIDNITCETEGRDAWLRNQYGDPIRNLSKEIREERFANEKEHHKPYRTVCEWKRAFAGSLAGMDSNPYYVGQQYKDFETGDIYVCRIFDFPKEIYPNGKGTFYMNVKNGLLVREADSQKFNRADGKYIISEEVNKQFIEYFNRKQQEQGYLPNSNVAWTSGFDRMESEFMKTVRLGEFYCNKNDILDIP